MKNVNFGHKVEEFTKETTFHGVKYVFDGQTKFFRRLSWLVCVIVVVVLFTVQVYQRCVVYRNYNTTISVNIYYTNSVPFPAVTICNTNTFRTSVVGREGWYNCITDVFTSGDWNTSSTNDCPNERTNATLTSEFFRRSGHQLDDFIFDCEWNGKTCDRREMFKPVWTDVGQCFVFNSEKQGLSATDTGTGQGLRLTLNIEADEYMAGPLSGSGAMVLLHDSEEVARMRDLAYAVSPGSHTLLAVKYRSVTDMKEPWGTCVPRSVPISTCVNKCNMRHAEKACGCRDVSLYLSPMQQKKETVTEGSVENDDLLPFCDVVGSLCLLKMSEGTTLSSMECDCSTPCERRDYSATVTNSMLDMNKIRQKIEKQGQREKVLKNMQEAMDVSAQVKDRVAREDNDVIDQVISTTNRLETVVKNALKMLEFNASGIENKLFSNVCEVFDEALRQTLKVAEDKICRIEHKINNMTSLMIFERFKIKICGTYCDDGCDIGFPLQVLAQLRRCHQFENFTNPGYDKAFNDLFQDICANASFEGFSLYYDYFHIPMISSSCLTIQKCAQDIFTLGFQDFQRDTPDSLPTVVESFRRDFLKLHNEFLASSPELNTTTNYEHLNDCNINLNNYIEFAESFYDLVDYFNADIDERDSQTLDALADEFVRYLEPASPPRIVFIKELILKNCFWFEKYFWWRHTTISDCYGQYLTMGIELDDKEALKVSKLHHLLKEENMDDNQDNKLTVLCNLDKWKNLVLDGRLVSYFDPYLVDRPFPFMCPAGVPEGTRPPWSKDPSLINSSFILDPNNPLFRAIQKVSCFFYPISDPLVPANTKMETVYGDFKKPLSDIDEYIQILQNISYTLKVYRSRLRGLMKSEVANFTIHPNVNEERVASDLYYFQNLIKKHSDIMKKLFSKVVLYGELFDTFSPFTEFTLANFMTDDIKKVGLFQFGEDLALQLMDIERCNEDEYMCSVEGEEDKILHEPFKQLCYQTGKKIYNINADIDAAIEDHNKAYRRLNENFKRYMNQWETLGTDFYQKNFLNLDIYYKQLSVEEVVQQPAFAFLSLLGEIGGFLGLLLGASVLTVCEIFDFILVNCIAACKRRKKSDNEADEVTSVHSIK